MQDQNQQAPQPRTGAGYRPTIPADLVKGSGTAATAYVVAAAGLGLAVGVAVAFSAGHSKTAGAKPADAFSTSGSSLNTLPAVYTGPSTSLLDKVDYTKKTPAGLPAATPAAVGAADKPAGAHKKHFMHRLWHWKKAKHEVAKRRPYVSPNPPATPDEPTALQRAAAAAADGPFFVGVEGEVTIASYDGSAGTIQTYEGSNFTLDKSAADAIRWQDYPFNVHYRCDGSGNCTLVRGSATAIARLTR